MNPTFVFNGTEFDLYRHPYNDTIENERAVEIPIALDFIGRCGSKAILEVGNVLDHYEDTQDRIVRVIDKYEVNPGVDNIDVMDIDGEWDAIVTISTIEHVGNEQSNGPLDLLAAMRAFHHLTSLLKPGGRMLATWATGYHHRLDLATLRFHGTPGYEVSTMVRYKDGWRQTETPELRSYGHPFQCANSVLIVEYRRPG